MTIGSVALMALTYPGDIEALAISSISSDSPLMVFGLLLDMLRHWCRDQVGKGSEACFFTGANDEKG